MKKILDRSKLAKTVKRKGSNAEREYAKKFRELGFSHCKTSRLGSKLHDDSGIDLIFLPFNVQIKAGIQRGLNPSNELKYVKDRMKELFPDTSPEHEYPTILIHRKDAGSGKTRDEYKDIVSMTFKDFEKFIKKIEKWN